MPDPDAPYQDDPGDAESVELRCAREAARIFRQLDETPEDPAALLAKETFLARGDAERETFARMERALGAARAGVRRKRRSNKTAGLICAFLLAAYFAYEPAKVRLLADQYTTSEVADARLLSGDMVTLDAVSAVVDHTDGAERHVTLLRGAAFFEVATDTRPFVVQAGGLNVMVLGTGFEVAEVGDHVMVTVFEGQVEVIAENETWRLKPRDRLVWKEDGPPELGRVNLDTVASWRQGSLIADGMTLAQVVAILDRRIPGQVVITDAKLGQTRVSGGLDLSTPMAALRLLASSTDAKVRNVPGLVTIVHP